jgi:uncharacterized protein
MTILTDKLLARPWYREPWPWLLMAGPCAVIVAGFFTLWLAVRSDDGLVADDYYKRGLAINQTLSRTQRAAQLALGARVAFDVPAARVRVTVMGTGELPQDLRLRLVHPTRAFADQLIELHAASPGTYDGRLAAPVAGRRVVMMEDVAQSWRLAGETTGEAQTAVLSPQ